jgi:ABC-type transport system involved in multi-copper enzyme maturation permease subunit
MTFFPIVERELRVAARRRSAFWTRLVAAGVAVAVGTISLWYEGEWSATTASGKQLFDTLAFVGFLFCLAAGPLFTADVLSEERREGTLGLLFLTDLRGYDIVGGKLAAASVTSVFSLLAALPVLAIPILLGGVPFAEFGAVALALGNALFVSLAAGVLVSAASVQARSAFALTVFLLFLIAGFCPWLHVFVGTKTWLGTVLVANPSSALELAQTISTRPSGPLLGWALTGTHGLGWLFLIGAAWLTQRAWREQGGPRAAVRWRERWQALNFGTATDRRLSRRHLLDRNPILWLASRNQLKTRLLWGAVAVALLAWLGWRWQTGPGSETWNSTFFIALFLQAPLKWLVASEASQRWTQEQQTGALELLLTTPLPVSEILRGHWLSLGRLFGVPALAILLVEILTLVVSGAFSGPRSEMGVMTLVGAVVFLWDLYALAWVGLWLGLSSRKPNQAFVGTGVRILVVPWIVFVFALFFTGIQGPLTLPVLWLVVCGLCNLVFQRWARQNLRELLRDLAPRRFSPAAG